MKINIKSVLAREEQRKAEVKPLPKVKIIRNVNTCTGKQDPPVGKPFDTTLDKVPSEVKKEVDQQISAVNEKAAVLADLWAQISAIKTERGIHSTNTAYLVLSIQEKLQAQCTSLANAFMEGDIADRDLKDHYAKIEALTDQAIVVWDKIQYVDKYGKLPGAAEAPKLDANTEDISAIKYELTRLKDRIHKTKKKLEGVQPKNPSRVAMWKQTLAMDEATRADLKQKLNRLEYEARAQRPGEE